MRKLDTKKDQTIRQSVISSVRVGGVVLGTAIIVLIALRNSFMWYMQEFWGASKDFWQSGWSVLYKDYLGESPLWAYSMAYPISFITFWLANALFLLVEFTGHPSVLLQYKIQSSKDVPLDPARLKQCIKVVLFNLGVVGPLLNCLVVPVIVWTSSTDLAELPSFHVAMLQLAGCAIVEEIGFYYAHRIFHSPYFYKRFHKIHHEFTAPIGIAAVYCHPLEHIIANSLPVAAGTILTGCHAVVLFVWLIIVNVSTTISHSGFHLPFMPSNEMHDYHHAKFNQCFGVLGILDQLHGTHARFVESKEYQRHIVLTSTTPARVLVPDEPKKCE